MRPCLEWEIRLYEMLTIVLPQIFARKNATLEFAPEMFLGFTLTRRLDNANSFLMEVAAATAIISKPWISALPIVVGQERMSSKCHDWQVFIIIRYSYAVCSLTWPLIPQVHWNRGNPIAIYPSARAIARPNSGGSISITKRAFASFLFSVVAQVII